MRASGSQRTQAILAASFVALGIAGDVFRVGSVLFGALGVTSPSPSVEIWVYLVLAPLAALVLTMMPSLAVSFAFWGFYVVLHDVDWIQALNGLFGLLLAGSLYMALVRSLPVRFGRAPEPSFAVRVVGGAVTAAAIALVYVIVQHATNPIRFELWSTVALVTFAVLVAGGEAVWALKRKLGIATPEISREWIVNPHSVSLGLIGILVIAGTGLSFQRVTMAEAERIAFRNAEQMMLNHSVDSQIDAEHELERARRAVESLSDLFSVQTGTVVLAGDRIRYAYGELTPIGADGIWWFDVAGRVIVAATALSGDVPDEVAATFRNEFIHLPRVAKDASVRRASVRTLRIRGAPHIVVACPVYWFRDNPFDARDTPDHRLKGMLILTIDLRPFLAEILRRGGATYEHSWGFWRDERGQVVVFGGIAEQALGERSRTALARVAREMPLDESVTGGYRFFREGHEVTSFEPGEMEMYRYGSAALRLAGGELVLVSAMPERIALQSTRVFARDLSAFTAVLGALLLLLAMVVLGTSVELNARLRNVVHEREAELRDVYERRTRQLEAVLENLPLGVFVVGRDGAIRLRNPAAAALLARSLGGEPAGIAGTPFADLANEVFSSGSVVRAERRIGTVLLGVTVAPASLSGEPVCVVALSDITEMRKLQEAQMLRSRIRSIGDLAAGVAHEIGNPLTIALGFAELLAGSNDLSEEKRGYAERIVHAIQRSSEVTKDMLLFGRGREGARSEPSSVNELAKYVADIVDPLFKECGIEFVDEIADDDVEVNLDPASFQHVLMNILQNAREAIQRAGIEDGRVTLRSRRDGEFVVFEIEDNGPGIPREIIDRVFDPFVTTKEKEAGFGIGLSVAYRLVEQDGGHIEIESEPGRGTLVRVTYPVLSVGKGPEAG